jgi:pyruvate ferredoxin oxidoreductase beta subunit/2-oxoisovalerate ferredoxin oxidoreductase beta subunit
MAAHRVPYAATLSIAHPDDFRDKVRKALQMEGFRFFLVHAPCPTGWKTEPAETVELVRLAVRSGVFPLYEVGNGVDYRINAEPDGTEPAEYFRRQKRFRADTVDIESLVRAVQERNRRLKQLAALA